MVFLFSVRARCSSSPNGGSCTGTQQAAEDGGSRGRHSGDSCCRIYGAHAFSWIGVQTMFVYIIAFIQQKMPLPLDPATAAEESGRIIAISFAILNTVGFLLPAPVLEPLAKRFGRVPRAHGRRGHHGGRVFRDRACRHNSRRCSTC